MWRTILGWSGLVLATGCFSPLTTRVPNLIPGNDRIERQAAQTKDPYPSRQLGPDTGFRPLEFQQARSEARQAKDQFFTWVRPRIGPGPGSPIPGAMYPFPGIAAAPAGVSVAPAWLPAHPALPGTFAPGYSAAPIPWMNGASVPPVAGYPVYPLY